MKMRYAALVLALAGAAILTGCSSLVSLNPFVAEAQYIVDPALAGAWTSADGSDKSLIVIRQKDSVYSVHFSDGKNSALDFEGHLVRVGDAEFMDIVTTSDQNLSIPVHMLVRIWCEGGMLKWVYLDSDWLRDQAKQNLLTQPTGERTLIIGSTDATVEFLKKFAADTKAYKNEINEMMRVN